MKTSYMANSLTLAMISLAINSIAVADRDDGFAIEEIIVTAQRRVQSLQDVPIAVSAFNQEFIKSADINDVTDMIAYTSGLTGANQGPSTPQYAIRGISSNTFGVGGESSVGVFVDDAYLGRITIAGLAFVDAERVEVLKGPQGTLFGRNTSAGAISITSVKPHNEFSIDLSQSFGEFDSAKTVATVNLPIIEDTLLVRGSVLHDTTDGYIEETINGNEFDSKVAAGKLQVSYLPTDDLTINLKLSAQSLRSGGRAYEPTDGSTPFLGGLNNNLYDDDVYHNVEGDENIDAFSANLKVAWDLNDTLTLTSITTFSEYDNDIVLDLDGTPSMVMQAAFPKEESETFGQEFRLNGEGENLTWMLGASLFKENTYQELVGTYDEAIWLSVFNAANTLLPLDLGWGPLCSDAAADVAFLGASCAAGISNSDSKGDFESVAIYGDFTYSLTSNLSINAGLRYSRDEKDWQYRSSAQADFLAAYDTAVGAGGALSAVGIIDNTNGQFVPLEDSWTEWTPRLALDYQFEDSMMLYASAARGYKSGGFEDLTVFEPETSWAYEIGMKSEWWNNRLQLNTAIYYYDYEDFQVQTVNNAITRTVNIPEVRGQGLEVDVIAKPLRQLDIIASLAISETEFGRFATEINGLAADLKDNATPYAPEKTASLVAEYLLPLGVGDVVLRGEAVYQGQQFFSIENLAEQSQGGYALYNARVSLRSTNEMWELALFGQNLGDKEYNLQVDDQVIDNVALRGIPRLVGIEFSLHL